MKSCGGFSVLVAVIVWLAAGSVVASVAEGGESKPLLGTGVFLVANPGMADPNFRETVILICDHGADGTLGLVVNRPTGLLLSEALPDIAVLKGTSYMLFAGGPVHPNAILMLFRAGDASADLRPVLEGIYLGGDLRILERVITQPRPTETFRAFAGYAGWATGQLEYEMRQGSWAILPADSMSLFDKEPTDLWPDLIERLKAPDVVRWRATWGEIEGAAVR